MMSAVLPYVLVIGAYLLGSVPFGVVVTRVFIGEDVRKVGSGNIGASNVTRAAGMIAAVVVGAGAGNGTPSSTGL